MTLDKKEKKIPKPGPAHALLSASSSDRWINCPGSVRLTELLSTDSTDFQREGTTAHAYMRFKLAELFLDKEAIALAVADLHKSTNEYALNDEIIENIEGILPFIEELAKDSEVILLEERLDYSEYARDGFGTGDIILLKNKELYVIDLKYGVGVSVSAVDNRQLKLYGLGGLNTFSPLYSFDTIHCHIIQPRLDYGYTSAIYSKEDLLYFSELVRVMSEVAYDNNLQNDPVLVAKYNEIMGLTLEENDCIPLFKAGDHCKFCAVKSICRARKEHIYVDPKVADNMAPELLQKEELEDMVIGAAETIKYLNAVISYVEHKLLNGVEFSKIHLVETPGRRAINDKDGLLEELKDVYAIDKITETKLISMTALEKLVGKKNFGANYGGYLTYQAGNPKIALKSEGGKEYNKLENIKNDFESVET